MPGVRQQRGAGAETRGAGRSAGGRERSTSAQGWSGLAGKVERFENQLDGVSRRFGIAVGADEEGVTVEIVHERDREETDLAVRAQRRDGGGAGPRGKAALVQF